MIDTTEIGLSIVAGPKILKQPFSSVALQEIIAYQPDKITKALLEYPGCQLVHHCDPTWWDWKVSFEQDNIHINIEMSLYETERDVFSSFDISGVCSAKFIVDILMFLRGKGFEAL